MKSSSNKIDSKAFIKKAILQIVMPAFWLTLLWWLVGPDGMQDWGWGVFWVVSLSVLAVWARTRIALLSLKTIEEVEVRKGKGRSDDVPIWCEDAAAELAAQAKIETPEVSLIDKDTPYCAAGKASRDGKSRGVIFVSKGALALLSEEELRAVMAHEIAHLKFSYGYDTLRARNFTAFATLAAFIGLHWPAVSGMEGFAAANPATSAFVGAFIVSAIGMLVVSWTSRRKELRADRLGAEFAGSPEVLAAGLTKIYESVAGDIDNDPEMRRVMAIHESTFGTHPPLAERDTALKAMVKERGSRPKNATPH